MFDGMRTEIALIAALMLSSAGAGPGLAQTGGRHVEASLVAESDAVTPGTALVVGLHLEMDAGWHTYWRNPGDAGLPTKVAWELPPGFVAGELQWPRPIRFHTGPLVSYGYEHEVLLPVEIQVPGALSADEVLLEAQASWLECKEVCLPGRADLTLLLPVRSSSRPGSAAPLFQRSRKVMPGKDPRWRFSAAAAEEAATLTVTPPPDVSLQWAYFYPLAKRVIDPSKPQALTNADGNGFRLGMAWHRRVKDVDRLEGVLVATTSQGIVGLEVDVPLEMALGRQPAEVGRSLARSFQGGSSGLHSSR